ncbi:MAG: hypothetical protein IPM70_01590 [Proteobacteria bacterium]|jgi:hypothetical protein|nr:hypothetical protein [Pseudomonadota bacterium]MBK7115711.1 hypothetical protein [Pseudomonadota bacterium]MBK9250631.1 hypothetical protein [Pseudomonadota bacterium]
MASDWPHASLFLAGTLLSIPAGAAEPLRHDVFARPTLSALTAAPPDSPASSPPTEWNPRLTAVMVAGRSSLATIDGRILKLGELVDGLRLLSVRDSEVVVEKDGQPYVLTMAAPSPVPSKNRGEQ